jgi:hypothetical protein
MNEFDRAITDIKTMRSQLARGAEFRGYGPFTVALTGVLALLAAWAQARFVPVPLAAPGLWLGLWAGTAALCVVAIGIEVVRRARRVHSGLADEMIQEAALQLLPAAGAGLMLSVVLWRYAPAALWMLPGLWQILLALGVFSACRTLPPAMNIVAFWYLGTGLACLAFGAGAHALAPVTMGGPFSLGEALAAVLIAVTGGGSEEDEHE